MQAEQGIARPGSSSQPRVVAIVTAYAAPVMLPVLFAPELASKVGKEEVVNQVPGW